jgi:hypothetical protein
MQRTDSKKIIENSFDLSFSSFINHNVVIGLTTKDAIADYIQEGFNPIQDSLIISNYHLFSRYYYNKRSFFVLKVPATFNGLNELPIHIDLSKNFLFERVRVGAGYVFHSKNNFDFEISYDVLLSQNINGWNKGNLSIGISTDASIFSSQLKN